MAEKRYFQIYTGNGKGKTTAAIGQAIRAAGEGYSTIFIMFMKDHPYNELKSLKRFDDLITIEQYGNDKFVFDKVPPGKKDKQAAGEAIKRAYEAIINRQYDIVILDEVCVSVYFKLINPEDLLPLIDNKPDEVELILTGRYCPQQWIDKADLVTEMTEIKHYYQQGVLSRPGFDS